MTPLTARRGLTIRSAAIPELNGAGWLEPLKLEGEEGINTLFEYRLVLQGAGGGGGGGGGGGALELDRFIGRELTCCIELEGHGRFLPGVPGGSPARRGAGVREISGLITQTRTLGQAGQRALVELTLRPWLHLATLTTDCKVFQDQSVVDIIETVLGEYPFAADKRLIERYPQRDYTVQYNESDYEFLIRLMQEWGINHHFEHSAGVHRLIWSDHNGAFQAVQPELQAGESAYHRIPYHPQGHKTERESIHGWSVEQRLTSGRYASRDLDYTRPGALLEVQAEGARAGGHANQEVYLWRGDKAAAHGQGAVAGSDHSQPNAGAQQAANQTQAQGEHLARLRMQALRQGGHRARGVGHLRGIVPGCSFHLTEHPQASANTEYLTLQAHLLIENVGEESQRSASAPAAQAVQDAQGNWQAGVFWEKVPLFDDDSGKGVIAKYRIPLNHTMRKYGINTPMRQASFVSNAIQESGWLARLQELGGESYWYTPWHGRGLLQLTHPGNYFKYWEWRGRMIPKALKTAMLTASQAEARKAPNLRSNAAMHDANFPELTQQMVEWRADVDGAEGTTRRNTGDALVAPTDSAGHYAIVNGMIKFSDEVHRVERYGLVVVDAEGQQQSERVYYRSPAFWKASAAVNLPSGVHRGDYKGINGFDSRCSAYGVALSVLTEMRLPDAEGNLTKERPEGYAVDSRRRQ